jgi:hypothetical protein
MPPSDTNSRLNVAHDTFRSAGRSNWSDASIGRVVSGLADSGICACAPITVSSHVSFRRVDPGGEQAGLPQRKARFLSRLTRYTAHQSVTGRHAFQLS